MVNQKCCHEKAELPAVGDVKEWRRGEEGGGKGDWVWKGWWWAV